MIAVIETGGKQYLVREGMPLTVEKLPQAVGEEVIFDKVLLLAKEDGSEVQLGTPYLDGVTVGAAVSAQGRARKIRVLKYKAKVRYRKVHGHRQYQTAVKIASL